MKEFNKVSFESSDSLPLGLMESDDGDEEPKVVSITLLLFKIYLIKVKFIIHLCI